MKVCLKTLQKTLHRTGWLHDATRRFDSIYNFGMMTGPPSVTPILRQYAVCCRRSSVYRKELKHI